ncbi:hypothetical protein CHS0354_004997 [Potamilus streckersoni]|uniref:Uncharacterized protein n=1 Tax=Potamilus streckersoni TaxID=2493646 RepID=A0AAE0W124_9BIVA|nr:hypothetical protein CHS0354_004997 [Potamilus streckersoni]
MRTSTLCFLCGLAVVLSVNSVMADISQRNCFLECMVQKYRKPVYCECSNTDKLQWGKRTPDGYRNRSPVRMPFRYGKRDSPFREQETEYAYGDSGPNTVGNIQSIGQYEYVE